MKTRIATFAILLGLLISMTAFANKPVPASKAVASSVANLIEDNLKYPEFAIQDKFEGEVLMELKIEDGGSFDVIAANSVNSKMKEHVIEAVENIDTDDYAQYSGQTVLVKVTYDLILY